MNGTRLMFSLALLAGWSNIVHAQQSASIAGTWKGTLEAARLTIVVNITAAADGKLSATMDSPDQGVKGIPVSAATFTGGVLKLVVTAVQGEYEGTLGADGKFTGQWRQGGAALPLVLEKGAPPARRPKPQEPSGELPYDQQNIRFPNTSANIDLAGTYTQPRASGKVPAVVLISGSGPQDRDESLLGHKPFLVLADHLTRNGIAVLRYDDRGVGESAGQFATATSADFMTDALAAVAWLKARPEIDGSRIGLVGHSEGGLIAPMAAASSRDVAYIVMLAGPGVIGEEILYEQGRKIARAAGAPEPAIEKNVGLQRRIFQIVKGTADTVQSKPALRTLMRAAIDSLTPAERSAMGFAGNLDAIIEAQTQQVSTPWFRAFLLYDPASSLERVTVPVLAINGEFDLQVPPEQNLPVIEQALQRANNKDVTIRQLPGLNHLFQTTATGSPNEYGTLEETFAPSALEIVSSWIRARFAT